MEFKKKESKKYPVSTALDTETLKKFKAFCKKQGLKQSEVIRQTIVNLIEMGE